MEYYIRTWLKKDRELPLMVEMKEQFKLRGGRTIYVYIESGRLETSCKGLGPDAWDTKILSFIKVDNILTYRLSVIHIGGE